MLRHPPAFDLKRPPGPLFREPSFLERNCVWTPVPGIFGRASNKGAGFSSPWSFATEGRWKRKTPIISLLDKRIGEKQTLLRILLTERSPLAETVLTHTKTQRNKCKEKLQKTNARRSNLNNSTLTNGGESTQIVFILSPCNYQNGHSCVFMYLDVSLIQNLNRRVGIATVNRPSQWPSL